MSDIAAKIEMGTSVAAVPEAAPRSPPLALVGPVGWLRANLFSSWLSSAVTLLLLYLIARWAIGFVEWAFVNAIWSVPVTNGQAQTQACRDLRGTGACWAVITEKHRFILFGTYPYEQHWRPALCVLLFVGLYIVSAMRRFWRKELLLVWLAVLTAIAMLMWGGDTAPPLPSLPALGIAALLVGAGLLLRERPGTWGLLLGIGVAALALVWWLNLAPLLVALPAPWPQLGFGALLAATAYLYRQGQLGIAPLGIAVVLFGLSFGTLLGLPYVPQERWGGLVITLILATFGLAFAFPLAVLVALGRRSSLPAIKALCVLYVELIRGVPLISLLFMASVMFPLFLPEGINVDKLLRAQIAIILFAGAYLAEVVRGGLQALPKGQYEAADALGLSYWQKTGFIILPQALRLVIPPLVNTFIGFFKDTSLVLIIGIFDLLTAGKTAIIEPAWQGFGVEVYVTVGVIYFVFCFAMSKYSQNLEAELNRHRVR